MLAPLTRLSYCKAKGSKRRELTKIERVAIWFFELRCQLLSGLAPLRSDGRLGCV